MVGYWRRRLPDWRLAQKPWLAAVPLGVIGALLASQAPSNALKFIYAIVMFAVAGVLYLESTVLGARFDTG